MRSAAAGFALRLLELGSAGTLMWTAIYVAFALVGIAITFLLHFAIRKEKLK